MAEKIALKAIFRFLTWQVTLFSVVTGRAGPTGRALDVGPEARRAFAVGPRAGQKTSQNWYKYGKIQIFGGASIMFQLHAV